jgi:hypothetical protein
MRDRYPRIPHSTPHASFRNTGPGERNGIATATLTEGLCPRLITRLSLPWLGNTEAGFGFWGLLASNPRLIA